jgi:hypothetical protein
MMNHRRLDRADIDVSVIALGTNQLRRVPERQEAASPASSRHELEKAT